MQKGLSSGIDADRVCLRKRRMVLHESGRHVRAVTAERGTDVTTGLW